MDDWMNGGMDECMNKMLSLRRSLRLKQSHALRNGWMDGWMNV